MTEISMQELISQEILNNPYEFYRKVREQGRLLHFTMGAMQGWLIATTYAETIELLKDPRLVSDRRNALPPGVLPPAPGGPLARFRQNMLNMDPPDHTRLRTLVSRAFTPRMIEHLRPRIQQITDELLAAVQSQGKMDVIADFAFPLPMTVISDMLGVPVEERKPFRTWTQDLLTSLATPENEAAGMAAAEAFIAYIKTLITRKRAHADDDLTSSLVRVEEEGDRLSEDELITMIWLLITAGHETTTNLLGNGVLALFQHPEQLHQLQQNPALLPSAIEELLRYTAPVLITGTRWAREDFPFHGQTIGRGDLVRILLISANSDPEQFTDPETLDITRVVKHHLAFSRGMHVCLGAPLARLEGQIALGTLLERFPNLHLACAPEQLTWSQVPFLRGLKALPVAF